MADVPNDIKNIYHHRSHLHILNMKHFARTHSHTHALWLGSVGVPPHFDCICAFDSRPNIPRKLRIYCWRLVFAIFTLKFHNFHFYTLWYHFYHIYYVLHFGPSHHNLVCAIKIKIWIANRKRSMENFNLGEKTKAWYLCKHLKYSLAFFNKFIISEL